MGSATTKREVSPVAERLGWRQRYARSLLVTDFLVLAWVIFGVQIAWFGFDVEDVAFKDRPADLAINYTAISVAILAAWLLMLHVYGTREHRVVGAGSQEYRLIADATIRVFGLVAIVALLLQISLARGYVLIAFPLGLVVLIFSRWMWRQWLGVKRVRGEFSSLVLLVGSRSSVLHISTELARQPEAGYRVVGVCVPPPRPHDPPLEDLLVLGDLDSARSALDQVGADTVVITSADDLPPQRVRELSWSLQPGRQHLVMAPSLIDIAGPRLHTRPVAGLPLIHVETPRYGGWKQFSKRLFDTVGSAALLILLSPAFLAIVLAVRLSSKGPIFYRQERIGRHGDPFKMLKFRSMRVGADAELAALLAAQGTSDKPLFKVVDDPRVTRIGSVLRKYSIDEIPQLWNVLRGDMSLVGPRPQREGEVKLYDNAAKRRLIVQPGMTGLWQVSGRSSLSWDDAIRLDLYYVENWSLTGDIVILWRTVRAVVAPGKDAF
ncbi:sugar transferase [Herbiconiux sp.]|uniref:sugar transferase n=1 Tax=Herbiconiux sp. TaxID=1871186 RepID=UPI0025C13359|nr:sugar transferase [Herbiconiux sp.]